MLLNLTDVFSSEGKIRTEEVTIERDVFASRMGAFPIVEKTPLSLTVKNDGVGRAKVCGHAKLVQVMDCDRCLREVKVPVELQFERDVFSPEITNDELEEESDGGVMNGYQLDIEVLVYNELLLNQPEKVLCKPDCKGICKKCGKDLNDGECGCDTFVPDPRMAVLQDIFNANKEV